MQLRVFESNDGLITVLKEVTGEPSPSEKITLRDPKSGNDRIATVQDVFDTVDIPQGISRDVIVLWDD